MRCVLLGVVVCLTATGCAEFASETFFGVDAAASWLTKPGLFTTPTGETNLTAYTVDKIDETGFRQVRERLSWGEVNPKPDVWDFSYYQRVYDLYRARGIRVSCVFHDAPSWMDKQGSLPKDLKRVYEFCRKVAETMGDRVDDWEFWNEEDIGFCPAAAWDYAAAAKAAYLGFKDASASRPALMGALCHASRTAYDDVLFANDLGLYTDAMNFHIYEPLASYPRVFDDLRKFMDAHGIGNRAIWVTESGTREEGQATEPGPQPGLLAHSPAQEEIHAEVAAKSQMAMMMEGVSRDYFFCFPPYNEQGGRKDWGVMRRNGTLKPAADVFREMIARLGKATLVGEAKDGFVFRQGDGSYTLCSVGKGRPIYRDGLADFSIVRPARKPGRLGAAPAAENEDRRIVLQVRTDERCFKLGDGKSALDMEGGVGEMTLVVYNFDGREKSGLVASKDNSVEGLPAKVTVPAWGKVEIPCRYRAKDDVPSERIVFRGSFDGRKTSRLVMTVKNLSARLGDCTVEPLSIDEDARWARNDSADVFETSWDNMERARKFHLVWKKENDRWTYPKYSVSSNELSGALMLEYEIKSAQDKVENDFMTANVMLFEDERTRRLGVRVPLGTWERRRVDFFGEKNLDAVKSIAIGLNPRGHDLTYWIRNVRLYKRCRVDSEKQ